MNATQIHAIYTSVLHFLVEGQLKNAFGKTKILVGELQIGEYADRLEDLQQNYRYLLQYYVAGVDDPQRKVVYNKILSKLFVLNQELREELLLRNSTSFEYTQKRYFPHTKRHSSPAPLLGALQYFHKQSDLLSNQEDNHQLELKRLRSNYEALLPELFNTFWLTTTYRSDEKALFARVLESDYPGLLEKSILISALTLNLWRMFDESKLMLLFDSCQSSDQGMRQRAFVGLCFILSRYNQFIPYFPSVRNRLVLLADNNLVVDNFKNIIIQLIATAETDKITKKMQEEILPEVMKISPLLKDKMDADSLLNSADSEEGNPAWQEIIENSGVSDKLRELNELQSEGADVYMSTFAVLKSFPFFSEFSHWFLPFDGHYSEVNVLFSSEDKTLLSAFMSNNAMCNSDKYSFCLSILQLPEAQRSMLTQSFKMEAEHLDEMAKDEAMLMPTVASKNISKQYIQDLFRFFKLYPQRTDFSDMFASSLIMHRSFLFHILSADSDFQMTIAEYYFSKNHHREALELFAEIVLQIAPSASIYQKIGYSHQQLSQLPQAVEAYKKADIIQPDDIWTIRKMAICYRQLGDFEKAVEFYQQANLLKPNQSSVLLQIGHCYLELRKYKEALDVYFKLDTDEGENTKVWRAIIWCAFVSGNIIQADYYMQKLLEAEPSAHDCLNAGHIAWCQHRLSDALDMYRKSMQLQLNNWELFLESFNEDKPHLLANGVAADEISLLIDELNPLML